MTLLEAAAALRKRDVSWVETHIHSAGADWQLNPKLNAFLTVTEDAALDAARTADAELVRGTDRGPLHGFP